MAASRFADGVVATGGKMPPAHNGGCGSEMSYIGFDPAGVQAWQGQLNSAHDQVITALNNYRTVAQQNNDVAHGSHFQNINSQCDDITNKHVTDHTDLHTQYAKASTDLEQGVQEVAGA
jgi:hypothetical protein